MILLALLFNLNYAQAAFLSFPTEIDGRDRRTCVAGEYEIRCLDVKKNVSYDLYSRPHFSYETRESELMVSGISSLSVGDRNLCFLQKSNVACTSIKEGISIEPPKIVPYLKNPRAVTIRGDSGAGACALTDYGGWCWEMNADSEIGDYFKTFTTFTDDIHASHISDSFVFNRVCIWGEGKMRCPGIEKYWEDWVGLKDIAARNHYVCAIFKDHMDCNFRHNFITYPSVTNPRSVKTGYEFACVLGDEGVKCWGAEAWQWAVPALNAPRVIMAGYRHACAIDDEGVKCWGPNAPVVPENWSMEKNFFLNRIVDHYGRYAFISTPARAVYFNGMKSWLSQEVRGEGAQMARYLALLLAAPIFESTDSEEFQRKVYPIWRDAVEDLRKKFKLENEDSIPDKILFRRVALASLASGLQVAQQFLPRDKYFGALMQAVGKALQDPSGVHCKTVRARLADARPLLSGLKLSPKSAFSLDLIEKAANRLTIVEDRQ